MAAVYVKSISTGKWLQINPESSDQQLTYDFIKDRLFEWERATSREINVKFFHGSYEIRPGCPLSLPLPQDAFLNTSISLAGGKGGFGSMLRAIGAQIEKTTNREACRDLSGRRLRDINEEKRLKDWVAKQAEREKEKEERKKKKLEKLKHEFHHEFHDPEYNKERAEVTDKAYEALEQGIKAASSSEPATKKCKVEASSPAIKKGALWVGVSDDETDSDDSESEAEKHPTNSDSDEQASSSSSGAKSAEIAVNNSTEQAEVPNESFSVAENEGAAKDAEIPKQNEEDSKEKAAKEAFEVQKHSNEEPATGSAKNPEPVKEPVTYSPIDLENYNSQEELEALGLDHLKEELQRRGLKCGGTVNQRAQRLFSIKGLKPEQIPPSLLAKPPKKN